MTHPYHYFVSFTYRKREWHEAPTQAFGNSVVAVKAPRVTAADIDEIEEVVLPQAFGRGNDNFVVLWFALLQPLPGDAGQGAGQDRVVVEGQ